MKDLKASGKHLTVGGTQLKANKERTPSMKTRDWILGRALELVEKDPRSAGKKVDIHFRPDRKITVNKESVFFQEPWIGRGTFSGRYTHLQLPQWAPGGALFTLACFCPSPPRRCPLLCFSRSGLFSLLHLLCCAYCSSLFCSCCSCFSLRCFCFSSRPLPCKSRAA